MAKQAGAASLPSLKEQQVTLGDWRLSSSRHHMLASRCHQDCSSKPDAPPCDFCRYSTLPLPLPEEVYPKNILRMEHLPSGAAIEVPTSVCIPFTQPHMPIWQFNAFDALLQVNSEQELFQVPYAKDWLASRTYTLFISLSFSSTHVDASLQAVDGDG